MIPSWHMAEKRAKKRRRKAEEGGDKSIVLARLPMSWGLNRLHVQQII